MFVRCLRNKSADSPCLRLRFHSRNHDSDSAGERCGTFAERFLTIRGTIEISRNNDDVGLRLYRANDLAHDQAVTSQPQSLEPTLRTELSRRIGRPERDPISPIANVLRLAEDLATNKTHVQVAEGILSDDGDVQPTHAGCGSRLIQSSPTDAHISPALSAPSQSAKCGCSVNLRHCAKPSSPRLMTRTSEGSKQSSRYGE